MENLPQNENNINEEEFSTIFSDPTVHNQKNKSGKSPRILKILSLVLIVAVIIGGTFAVIKLIPEKEDETTSSDNKITVLDYTTDDIKEITVSNKNGSFNIYSKVVEAKGEEDVTETFWYLKGYDSDLTDSAVLESVVSDAVSFDAIRTIESKSDNECGLDKPLVVVNIKDNDGKEKIVKIGNKSPDNSGVYLKVSGKDDTYIVGKMLDEELTFTDLDFASTEAQSPIKLDDKYDDYLSDDTIISFDTITISGNDFANDIVFEPNKDEKLSGFLPYYLTKPMERAANNGDVIMSLFSQGFPVNGAYSYDAEKATLNKFGLNDPDYEVTAKFDDYTYTYKFKKQRDGDYAFVGNDSKNVKRVSVEDCGFLTYNTYDFYNKTVFIVSIDMISNLKFETVNGNYDFSISASSKGDEETKDYIVECNGKTYNATYFKSFYQFLCGLEAMEFDVEKTSQKPILTMTYSYNDKSLKPTVVEFVKINATRYQYYVDGVAMGKIGSSSFNKINKNLERLLDGKQIVVN